MMKIFDNFLFPKEFGEEERDYFFSNTLPAMIRLALNLPKLVTQPPPLLTSRATHSITLSQMQVCVLLCIDTIVYPQTSQVWHWLVCWH